MRVHCSSCDAPADPPATFCGRCGARLPPPSIGPGTATIGALVAPGARRAKMALLLGVNAALLGSGGWFIVSFLTAAPPAEALELAAPFVASRPVATAPAATAPAATAPAATAPVAVPVADPISPTPEPPAPPPPPRASRAPGLLPPLIPPPPRTRVARVRPVAVHPAKPS